MVTLSHAYEECEAITRREAKNFAYGIKLLRVPERRAMSAAYALARRIDDIGDGDADPAEKLERLQEIRTQLEHLGDVGDDSVLLAVRDAARAYRLPLGCFNEIITGCEHDVVGRHYETIDELVGYCRLVAGSVGRLSLSVFDRDPSERAITCADDLGVALQLTNILRDVVEDRDNGRVYLPSADARALGCAPELDGTPEEVARLVSFECARAEEWFVKGLQLLPLLDRRSRACVSAMAGIYRRLLGRISADPISVTQRRVSLPTWEKAVVAARSLAGAQP
jgi:phytoene synthase